MSTAVAVPEKTWRDELTPLSRASRRRWVVAYAGLLVLAAVYVGTSDTDENGSSLLLAMALFVVFGMLRRGTRRLTAFDHPDLDERDARARERAFRLAYPALLLVLTAVAVILLVALPDASRPIFGSDGTPGTSASSYLDAEVVLGLAIWVALWAAFLPTGVLAWIEPDALEHDEPRREGLSEAGRDAVLAVALVAGGAISLLSGASGLALLPLVGVFGVLELRAQGPDRPPRSTAGRVLPLVGVALAVGFVLVVLLG